MFYLSKPFLETKTHFSIQIHRTLYVRESKLAIFLGHFPFIRTGRPDHCRNSKFNNELGFFQEFLLKNHDLLWCILFRIWLIWREWSGRSVLKSGKPPKARLQAAILKMSPQSPPPPTEQRKSSLQQSWIRDSGFGIRDSRYWITDSLSVELGFRISIVIRIPKPRIPDSRSKVQIFLRRATLKHFLSFFYTTTKNTKNHLSIQKVTFLAISTSRATVAKNLLMWAFTTLPPIHMRWKTFVTSSRILWRHWWLGWSTIDRVLYPPRKSLPRVKQGKWLVGRDTGDHGKIEDSLVFLVDWSASVHSQGGLNKD